MSGLTQPNVVIIVQGYCDVFRKCRQVDAEGPLVRLKNLLLGERALTSAREWLTENWWAATLAGVGLVVATGMIKNVLMVPNPTGQCLVSVLYLHVRVLPNQIWWKISCHRLTADRANRTDGSLDQWPIIRRPK